MASAVSVPPPPPPPRPYPQGQVVLTMGLAEAAVLFALLGSAGGAHFQLYRVLGDAIAQGDRSW